MESRLIALALTVAALTIGLSIAVPETVAQAISWLKHSNIAARGFILAIAGLSFLLAALFFADYWNGVPVTLFSAVVAWLVLIGAGIGATIVFLSAWYPGPILTAITMARESAPITIAKGISTMIFAFLAILGVVGMYRT